MRITKKVLILLALATLFVGSLTACKGKNEASYSDAELSKMSANDLYEVLTENGLQISKNFKQKMTKDQLAEYIKTDFELLKKGASSRSSSGYKEIAIDIKKIYESITRK